MRLMEFDLDQPGIKVPVGSRGPAWADLQKALIALGYKLPRHGVDGISGAETRSAIRQFEKNNKLTINGSPDQEMINLMNKILKDKGISFPKSTEKDVRPGQDFSNLKKVRTGPHLRIDPDTRRRAKDSIKGLDRPVASSVRDAYNYFIDQGWTPAQAAGIVGNLQAESGINLNINTVGDNGKAYGIAQWHPDRQEKFKKVFGKDIRQSSLGEQLAFVNWELENTENKAGRMLRTADSAEQAAIIFDRYYERSAGLHTNKRIALANAVLASRSDIG